MINDFSSIWNKTKWNVTVDINFKSNYIMKTNDLIESPLDIYRIMYALESQTVSVLTRGLFSCLFPELLRNSGNIYQNNTRVSAETVHHESTYINLSLARHNKSINDNKNNYLFTLSPCLSHLVFVLLMTSQSIADDVTSQWPYNCDAITWIVISNSLDIDFIYGDIHGESCKNICYYMVNLSINKTGDHVKQDGRPCFGKYSCIYSIVV